MAATVCRKRSSDELDTMSKRPRFTNVGKVCSEDVGSEDVEMAVYHSPSQPRDTTPDEDGSSTTPNTFDATEPSIAETSNTSATTFKRPKRYKCDHEGCGKAFDRPIRLETHIRSHTNERPFECGEEGCAKAFRRVENLKAHMQTQHSDVKNYVCDYVIVVDGEEQPCEKSFHTGTRLRRHIAAHEKKETKTCEYPDCGQVFRKLETLQRHIKADHLHEKPFRCAHVMTGPDLHSAAEECGKTFATATQLKGHENREHIGKRYFCEICTPAQTIPVETNEPSHSTIQPGFATYAELQAHSKLAHPPECSICGHVCESGRALKAHLDIEHTSLSSRQNIACPWEGCDRKFTKKGNLAVHVQTVHKKVRSFVCGSTDLTGSKKVEGWSGDGCNMGFSTKASLEEHVRTQHLRLAGSVRPCRKDKKIKQETNEADTPHNAPRNAIDLLTGDGYDKRPFACTITGCRLRFVRTYDLGTHLELTHGWQVEDVQETLDKLAERQALNGGKFWLGGDESPAPYMSAELSTQDMHDSGLGQRLRDALDFENAMEEGYKVSFEQGLNAVDADPQFATSKLGEEKYGDEMEDIAVDPALATI